MTSGDPPRIYVLAGTNGAGKTDILGATIEDRGGEYFNPDREARELRKKDPTLSQEAANGAAWQAGKERLERAIRDRGTFAFETTLGAHTIPTLLAKACDEGIEVHVLYVGLSSPELHIARVAARVAKGGHPIDEAMIRQRYETSQLNLIRLLPKLTSLKVLDNSEETDPRSAAPVMKLVLDWRRGRIVGPSDLAQTPQWAKAIVAAAIEHHAVARDSV